MTTQQYWATVARSKDVNTYQQDQLSFDILQSVLFISLKSKSRWLYFHIQYL